VRPLDAEIELAPGEYRPAMRGVVLLDGDPAWRRFQVKGRPFRVVGEDWRSELIDQRVRELKLDETVAQAAVPTRGELLATVSPLGSFERKGNAWLTGTWPIEDPGFAVISFPANTASSPGDFASVSMAAAMPEFRGRLHAQLLLADRFLNSDWPGYRFYEFLVDGKLVWEEDITADRTGRHWTTVDITDEVRAGEDVTLTVRVHDRRGVGQYPTTSIIGPVRLVEVTE
jgi:hypothetical protein